MDDRALNEHFVRFRDHRDADALAKVFDRLAPGLLGVARHLTRDRSLAEDLLQATFLTAMEKASIFDETRPLRPWLAGILVLHARRMQRASLREPHSAEDERAARADTRDPSEIASDRELEEEVDRALRSLPDRYRQVLVPRFLLGRRGTEIARDTGRSPGVVRMQIHRGLELLRRALPQSLLAALFGFFFLRQSLASVRTRILAEAAAPAAVSQSPALLVGGAIIMKKLVIATACVALVAGASFMILEDGSEPSLDTDTTARVMPADDLEMPRGDAGTLHGDTETVPILPRNDTVAGSAGGTARSGRVFDPRGQTVAGVRLYFEEKRDEAVVSDAEGRFEFSHWYGVRSLRAAPPFMLMRAGSQAGSDDFTLVAAFRIDVNGTVMGEDGITLEGARIEVRPVRLVGFPEIIDHSLQNDTILARHKSDARGRFILTDLPGECAILEIENKGFESLSVPVDAAIAGDRTFVLRPLSSDRIVVTGRVLDHTSRTVPCARVGLGGYRTQSDDWGIFRIDMHREEIPDEGATLYAAKRGYRTKVITGFGAGPDELPQQVDLDILLDGPALAISGTLLDQHENPVEGATMLPWQEEFLAGKEIAEDLAVLDRPAANLDGTPRFVVPDCHAFAVTDEEGSFFIGGLNDRTYRFRVFDDEAGFAMTTRPIKAGSRNVKIVIPANAFHDELSGRVVDRSGRPVAGAEIRIAMQWMDNSDTNSWIGVGSARCDENGRFVIRQACRLDTIIIDVSGPGVCTLSKRIQPDHAGGELTLVVERLCYFRVELSDPEMAHAINILDENGEKLEISEQGGMQTFRRTPFPLQDGKTEVVSTSDRACTIRLIGETERLLPVRLVPGEVTVLRF